MSDVRVLGIDPGFASFGWAIVELGASSVRPVALGVIRTKPSPKKRRVRATDDNVERCREISEAIARLLEEHLPVAIAAEAMSFPRSSAVAAKMAMAWGVVVDRATLLRLPIVQATPQEVKRALTGARDASKLDVRAELVRRFPGLAGLLVGVPGGEHEHPLDALASVLAGLDSEALRMARRLSTGGAVS